jgi:photosystem II stability/assembly factor-like uncharacterized protein
VIIFDAMRIALFSALLCCQAVIAQIAPTEKLKNYGPRAIGPGSMSGRVTSIAVVSKDPNTIYIGTASGGLWKSNSGGLAWSPIFDTMGTSSIGAVAVQQNNPDVVWVGTGEGNPRNSHNSGNGIYVSLDAGRSWKRMGLERTRNIHRILINPNNPSEVYVAALGSIWGPNPERGVYKTTDAGKTWNKILFSNDLSGCAELVMDPSNPNKLFANLWEYQRKPYTFNSGGKGSGLHMSVDGGLTWKKLGETEGLPSGIVGRMGIAIAPSESNVVYALVESSEHALYRSDNGGYRWTRVSSNPNIGNRPFYYSEIYVDPSNANHVISIWSQVTHSIDGGKNWDVLLDWNHIHPDHHAFYIHPENPNLMMDGNDGGFNISTDGGNNWRYVSNLPVGQFYHVNVDNSIPYHVYGGLQDNGSWKGPGFNWREGGLRNSDWQEILFGDGFDVLPLANDDTRGYAAWQGGNAYFYDLNSGLSQAIQPAHPRGEYLRFNWNAGMALHPKNTNGIYLGSQYLHKSYNNGLSWTIISPDLTTNDTSKMHQAKSGGLTIDATNAENYCTIITIAPSTADTAVIWVGTDDGNLQLTRDGGKTWQLQNSGMPDLPKNGWIPNIWTNPANAAEAWVVVNNYRQNDWNPYLYKTQDFGKTWQRMVQPNQVSGHCLSVLRDPKEPKLVWLGTDHGLWVSFDGATTWTPWKHGMPNCPVQDMVYQAQENDLVLATFGRGIYIFDDIEPFRNMAKGFNPTQTKIMHTGHGYLTLGQRPDGERFGADDFYEAPNKPSGAPIDLYVAGKRNSKTQKWEQKKVQFSIWNKNQMLRSWESSFDSTGYYRMHWNMRRDGYRFPSHYNAKNEIYLPAGMQLPPGMYTLKLKDGDQMDSSAIEIKTIAENPFNAAGYNEKLRLSDSLQRITQRAYLAFEALKTAEETIEKVCNSSYENDSAQSRLKKLSAPLKDSINALKRLFMQDKDITYYEDITQRLNDKLYAASGYINSQNYPAENANTAVRNAAVFTDGVLKRVNAFLAAQWAGFQIEVEKEKPKVFKPLGGY